MDLSIIIPVYNTDILILERCLNSAKQMSISEYEVLIVDDGSENTVKEFCIDFIKDKPNFIYFEKSNGGVSSARNFGLEQAKGKYITFLDSDDELISDITFDMLTYQNADLVFFDRTLVKDNYSSIRKELPLSEGWVQLSDIYKAIISQNRFHGPVGRFYKLELIRKHNIYFDKKMIQGEDILFNIEYLFYCNKIYYDTRSIYRYYLSPITLVNRWKKSPVLMFANLLAIYKKKKEIVGILSSKSKEDFLSLLTRNTLYSLFQSVMDMVEAKVLSPELKVACVNFCNQLLKNKAKLSIKSAISTFIIKNRLWILVIIICPIRHFIVKNIRKKWK